MQAVPLQFDSLVASKKALKMMQAFSICELNSINLMEWRESFCSVLSWEIFWHSGHLPSSPYCLFYVLLWICSIFCSGSSWQDSGAFTSLTAFCICTAPCTTQPKFCAGLLRAPTVNVINNDNKICQQWTTWPCKSLTARANVSSLENGHPHVCIILSSLYCLSCANIGQQPNKSMG